MLWYCFLEIKEGMLVVREVLYVGKDEEMERGLRYRWIVWGVMVLSYVVVFFHRLAAGVVRNDLVEAFGLSGAAFGTLA
jgi:sugar phosphate permease